VEGVRVGALHEHRELALVLPSPVHLFPNVRLREKQNEREREREIERWRESYG